MCNFHVNFVKAAGSGWNKYKKENSNQNIDISFFCQCNFIMSNNNNNINDKINKKQWM